MNQPVLSFLFFLLATAGLFFLLKIPFTEFFSRWAEILRGGGKNSRKHRREIILGKKPKRRLSRRIHDTKEILAQAGKPRYFPFLVALSVVFAVAGAFIALAMDNWFLLPVLAVGLCTLPFVYVSYKRPAIVKRLNVSMKTALGVVTSTYIQCENLPYAVKTNLAVIPQPFNELFREFVAETDFIEANMPRAVTDLKNKYNNRLWREWCDMLIQCSDNKELKFVLPVIVDKISDVIKVQSEVDTMIFPEAAHFRTIFVIAVLFLPIVYMVQKTWFLGLVGNTVGKLVIAAALFIDFTALLFFAKSAQPID